MFHKNPYSDLEGDAYFIINVARRTTGDGRQSGRTKGDYKSMAQVS